MMDTINAIPAVDIQLYVCTVCDAEFGQYDFYQRHLLGQWHRERVQNATADQAQMERSLRECTMLVRQVTVSDTLPPSQASVGSGCNLQAPPKPARGSLGRHQGRLRKALDCPAPHCRAPLENAAELDAHWAMCVVGGWGRAPDGDGDGAEAAADARQLEWYKDLVECEPETEPESESEPETESMPDGREMLGATYNLSSGEAELFEAIANRDKRRCMCEECYGYFVAQWNGWEPKICKECASNHWSKIVRPRK